MLGVHVIGTGATDLVHIGQAVMAAAPAGSTSSSPRSSTTRRSPSPTRSRRWTPTTASRRCEAFGRSRSRAAAAGAARCARTVVRAGPAARLAAGLARHAWFGCVAASACALASRAARAASSASARGAAVRCGDRRSAGGAIAGAGSVGRLRAGRCRGGAGRPRAGPDPSVARARLRTWRRPPRPSFASKRSRCASAWENSDGITKILFASPCASCGSICRYW